MALWGSSDPVLPHPLTNTSPTTQITARSTRLTVARERRSVHAMRFSQTVTLAASEIDADIDLQLLPLNMSLTGVPAGVRRDVSFETMSGDPIPFVWAAQDGSTIHRSAFTNRNPNRRAVYDAAAGKLIWVSVQRFYTQATVMGSTDGSDAQNIRLFTAADPDDHRIGPTIVRPDGRYLMFQAGHGGTLVRHWISENAGSLATVSAEYALTDLEGTITHPSACHVSGSNEVWVFYRAVADKWKIAKSTNAATTAWNVAPTWSTPYALVAGTGNNEYIKVYDNGAGRADILHVDGTPGTTSYRTSARHFYVDLVAGTCHKTDGTLIRSLAAVEAGSPITAADMTLVLSGDTAGSVWNYSIARYADGRVAIAVSVTPPTLDDVNDLSAHEYWHCEQNTVGSNTWTCRKVCDAGPSVSPVGQPPGAGGCYLDYANPDNLAVSVPRTGDTFDSDGMFEIDEMVRTSAGTWHAKPLTRDSTRDQVRPLCVHGYVADACPRWLWCDLEHFFDYGDFESRMRCWPAMDPPGRNLVYLRLTGLDQAEAYQFRVVWNTDSTSMVVEADPGRGFFDADDIEFVPMEVGDAGGLMIRDATGRYMPVAGTEAFIDPSLVVEVGLAGGNRFRFDGSTTYDGIRFDNPDNLAGATELEVAALVTYEDSVPANRYIVACLDSSRAGFQIRSFASGAQTQMHAQVTIAPNTNIGGVFSDLLLTPGVHFVLMRYTQAGGLRLSLDGAWSATTYTGGGAALDADQATTAFCIGRNNAGSTNRWLGTIQRVTVRTATAPDASWAIERVAFTSPATLLSFGPVEAVPRLRVRERSRLALHASLETPTGRRYRWAQDEPDATNVLSGLRHSDTMPGGFESCDLVLPRKPGVTYRDLERLSTLTLYGPGGEIAGEYRLERTPRVSGDQMSVSPGLVGWQAHLEDDKSAMMVYADQEIGQWHEAPVSRRLAISTAGRPTGKIPVSNGNGGVTWEFPNEALPDEEVTELHYDIGVGMKVARLEYRGQQANIGASVEAATVFASDSENFASSTDEALTLNDTINTATTFTDGRYLMLRARVASGPVTPSAGTQRSFERLTAYGNHGVALSSVSGGTSGFVASAVVEHAVGRWAPLLVINDDSIQPSGFVIPHLAFRERTTAGEIVRRATRFGLQDWGVWEGREFVWHQRGARGRSWRARISPAQLEETGPSVERLWNSIIVQYQDVDGSTRTVGPEGSGADTEDVVLQDDDPDNPANRLGIARRDLLQMGVGTVASATEIGRRFLEETKLLDSSGRAQLVGHVEDDRGIVHPYWKVRAGDTITFVDASDTSERRVVRSEKDYASRTCTVDLDAPPEGLQATLERLGVVLVPLGL
jgi:hypothetical protein